jgi:hypothetical protein
LSINAKTVVRCIIAGEWIWVERGTFTVIPLEFEDDDGNVIRVGNEMGYFFTSTQGDPYYGPMSAIQLMKLDSQLMEETGSGPRQRGRPAALPAGDGTSGPVSASRFEDEAGVPRSATPGVEDEVPDEHAPVVATSVPLFADDVDDDGDLEPRRRGGLF